MKNVRYLWVAVPAFFALTVVTRADPDPTDPRLQYDADGVPLSVSRPKAPQLTPDEVAAIRKQQAQAASDKDWLLRNYEKQLRLNASGASGDDQSGNLYDQLSSNKDLAKLAGLPDIDDGGNPTYRTGGAQPDRHATPLRSPAANPAKSLQGGSFLKPLITPLGAPDAAGLSNFYSSLGGAAAAPFAGTVPPPRAAPVTAATEDPADIDTPGMIAAEKNPSPDTLDLSLNVLPGESIDHARAHQDDDELLALPLPQDADQLHHAETASLSPKGVTAGPQAAATTPVPAKPIPVDDEDAPVPVSKQPVINPVRAPIANPYDILNR